MRDPLKWKEPRRIFVNSMSDLFHEKVSDETIAQVFEVMAEAQRHTFQVLTKRPERMLRWFTDYLPDACSGEQPAERWPLPNVWLGVSVENQAAADERIPLLLRTPAAVRFLSCEPLLGPVSIDPWLGEEGFDPDGPDEDGLPKYMPPIDWVIVGGESGPHARPMHPDWAIHLASECEEWNVPFFFKQWGEWFPLASADEADNYPSVPMTDDHRHVRLGKKKAGRELLGRTWDQFPEPTPAGAP
jgi:protein gp37